MVVKICRIRTKLAQKQDLIYNTLSALLPECQSRFLPLARLTIPPTKISLLLFSMRPITYWQWINHLKSSRHRTVLTRKISRNRLQCKLGISRYFTVDIYSLLFYSAICNKYMQLGARGTTVIFGSGDAGIAGAIQPEECDGKPFIPTFPGKLN